jgi:hypothetical protein
MGQDYRNLQNRKIFPKLNIVFLMAYSNLGWLRISDDLNLLTTSSGGGLRGYPTTSLGVPKAAQDAH